MTKPETALRELAEKTFPLFGSRLDEWRKVEQDKLISDLTALISEHYVAKEEVDKMVSERLREELIKYDKYIGNKGWIDNYEDETAIPTVDEYLKWIVSHDR